MKLSTKRALATASITGLALVSLGGVASAGEITGNGVQKPTPLNGKSECAFSGQNDGWHDGTESSRVQNWGSDRDFLVNVLHLPKNLVGYACNPSGMHLPPMM